tara:strand:- start:141 stop:620 length:480 start_codon:yes stop_codon:yes gene_type:complete
MNIFFLDETPEKSAKMLCDKHVPKMLLESCQMLSTALRQNGYEDDYLYKSAHPNHPMTKWVGNTRDNFIWAFRNADEISREYYKRFGKVHKSTRILDFITDNEMQTEIPDKSFTTPPQCMPDEYKDKDYVVAYRRYYVGEKKYFAKWEKGRSQPEWWVQ